LVEATRTWFADANHRALEDPRVRLVLDDGRSFVERGTEKFDVIISEPPNIWVSGVSGLFTTEFYRAARARLRPGGMLCQWLPLYELSKEDFATALATMGTQFEHLAGWTNGSVAIIIASPDPLLLEVRTPRRQLPSAVAADLQLVGLMPWQIDSFLSQPDLDTATIAGLRASTRDLNLDDHPVLEFHSAANLFRLTKPGANKRWAARLPKQRS